MSECSSRGVQCGCLYCLLSVTAKQQQSSRSAGVVLQLNQHSGAQHSERTKTVLLGRGGTVQSSPLMISNAGIHMKQVNREEIFHNGSLILH